MPNFRYLAMTQSGELVNGSILAPTCRGSRPPHRISRSRPDRNGRRRRQSRRSARTAVGFFNRPRAEDVTIFTRDLALLLKAGARLDTGLELLADDNDIGRLRPIVNKIRAGVLAGESFAEAIAQHPAFFPPIYVALVQVGETSGKLVYILEMLANERMRAEALRRKVTDALHYPAFILLAASCVLTFFILFVLPQFSSVLRDFNAKTDSMINIFLGISDFVRGHGSEIVVALVDPDPWLLGRAAPASRPRQDHFQSGADAGHILGVQFLSHIPILSQSGHPVRQRGHAYGNVTNSGRHHVGHWRFTVWLTAADRVRHGGRLSDALSASAILPPMAIRMIRIGEETGQLPTLAARIAEFYEAKLQRSLDRVVAVVGPLAIISISIVVGGLIVSIMTALLSISQIVE